MDESIPMPSETPEQTRLRGATGVVSVDGQHYAVGLIWQPLQNLDDPMLEVRETAESEMGADLYCLRPATTPQYGIGRTELEHKDGMPSLAAAVASVYADQSSMCGVFKVDRGIGRCRACQDELRGLLATVTGHPDRIPKRGSVLPFIN